MGPQVHFEESTHPKRHHQALSLPLFPIIEYTETFRSEINSPRGSQLFQALNTLVD